MTVEELQANCMRTGEVAEVLGCTRQWVQYLTNTQRIPHYRFGNVTLYHRAEIAKYLEGRNGTNSQTD